MLSTSEVDQRRGTTNSAIFWQTNHPAVKAVERMISTQNPIAEAQVVSEPAEMKSSIEDTVVEAATTVSNPIAAKVDAFLSDLGRKVHGKQGELHQVLDEYKGKDLHHVKLLKKRNFVTMMMGKPKKIFWKDDDYVMLDGRVQATTFRDFVVVAAFYTEGDNRWFLIATQNLNGDYFCSGKQPHPSIAARKANEFLASDVGNTDVMKICDGEGCLAFGMSQREFFQIVAKQAPFKEAFASFRFKENPRFPRDKPTKRERSPPSTVIVQEQEIFTVGRPKRICTQRQTLRAPSPQTTPKQSYPVYRGKGKGLHIPTIEPTGNLQDTHHTKPTWTTTELNRSTSGFTNTDVQKEDSFFTRLVGGSIQDNFEPFEIITYGGNPLLATRSFTENSTSEVFASMEWSADHEIPAKIAPLSALQPEDFAATFGATRTKSVDASLRLPQ